MTTLLDEYNAADKHDLHGLAKFHADYEAIHPFQDGNGRTGRLILFKECLKNDIIPFVINDRRKAEYYHALNTAQTKQDYSLLERFFRCDANTSHSTAPTPKAMRSNRTGRTMLNRLFR